jgi:hypothetical protein
MARKSQAQIQIDRIKAAMTPLVGIPQFADYITMLGELKDEAVSYSVDSDTVKSERESLVVKGEIRAYLNQINIYKGELEQLEQQIKAEAEQRQQQTQ